MEVNTLPVDDRIDRDWTQRGAFLAAIRRPTIAELRLLRVRSDAIRNTCIAHRRSKRTCRTQYAPAARTRRNRLQVGLVPSFARNASMPLQVLMETSCDNWYAKSAGVLAM